METPGASSAVVPQFVVWVVAPVGVTDTVVSVTSPVFSICMGQVMLTAAAHTDTGKGLISACHWQSLEGVLHTIGGTAAVLCADFCGMHENFGSC